MLVDGYQFGDNIGDNRPTLIHYRNGEFLTPYQTYIYRAIKSLNPFYRGVVVAESRANENLFPWTEFEIKMGSPAHLAHRLVSRYGFPIAVLAHCGQAGYKFLETAKVLDVPIITIVDDGWLNDKLLPFWMEAYENLFCYGTLFLWTSDVLRSMAIKQGCPANRTFTWRRGVDFTELPSKNVNKKDGRRILRVIMSGRPDEKKGHVYGVKAFARAFRDIPDVELCIVGYEEAENPNLLAAIRALEIGDKVVFKGFLTYAEVVKEMLEADIALHPSVTPQSSSWTEGVPNVLTEAHGCELPVVATNHAGIPEVVLDGESGFLVEERNVDAMAAALKTLANDKDLRIRFGRRGRRHVESEFNYHLQARRLAAYIEHAVALHRQRRMPLTSGVPALPKASEPFASSHNKFSSIKGQNQRASKLWDPYSRSHRKFPVGALIRAWKKLTYSIILKPVVTMVANELEKAHKRKLFPSDSLEEMCQYNIDITRAFQEFRRYLTSRPTEGVAIKDDTLTMDSVTCGDCPHCDSASLWPRQPCPLDRLCLKTLQKENVPKPYDIDEYEDPSQSFDQWLENMETVVEVVCKDSEKTPDSDQATRLCFEEGRLNAEDSSCGGITVSMPGGGKQLLRARMEEIMRVLRPGGRCVLRIERFGMSAWGGDVLGLNGAPPFAQLVFPSETFVDTWNVNSQMNDIAGVSHLNSIIREKKWEIIYWQPFYDSSFPVTYVARFRSALNKYNHQDMFTVGVLCALNKPI